jgi:phenylacetate-CoA ligase
MMGVEEPAPLSTEQARRRFFEAFRWMERWPYEDLLDHQVAETERLLRYVRENVPPLANRVEPLFDGEDFHPERWGQLPILTRPEVQEITPALDALQPPETMGGFERSSTSGSTGQPVRVRRTALAAAAARSMRDRIYFWHGFDPNACMAGISPDWRKSEWPDGESSGSWCCYGAEGTKRTLTIFVEAEKQLDWLIRVRPRYLTTISSNLHELAEAALATGQSVEIEAIIAAGTMLSQETRELAAKAFGARVIDVYACEEMGPIAIQCPESGLMHTCAEHMIVEVIDDDGAPVPTNSAGRIILTGFYNYATPLLRYEIGDVVETAAGRCSCGRSLPALRRVVGRNRRPLRFPDGTQVRVHAAVVAAGVPEILPAKQFQIAQVAPTRFEIRYVPRDAGFRPDADVIQRRFRELVHPSADVVLVAVSEIARGARGKYQDFVYFDA